MQNLDIYQGGYKLVRIIYYLTGTRQVEFAARLII